MGAWEAWDIVIMMQQKQMKNGMHLPRSFFSLIETNVAHMIDSRVKDFPHKLSAQAQEHHAFHICITLIHTA